MVVVLVTAAVVVAAAVLVVVGAGCLSPSVKPVLAPVMDGTTVLAAAVEEETVVAAPKGFSIKDKGPPAVVVAGAELVATEVGAMGRANPVPTIGAGLAVAADRENNDGAEDGAAWVVGGGAGVVEGLMPRVKPPDWVVVTAVVAAGGWPPRVNVDGATDPNVNPPPGAAVEAAVVVACTFVPKLKPPKAVGAVVAAGAATGCWAWVTAPKLKPFPTGAAVLCEESPPPRVKPVPAAGAVVEPNVSPGAVVV